MNAVLALVFFACIAGSMASSTNAQLLGQIVQQGQTVAQAVIGQLQQQILTLVQSAVGQLSTLVGSLGRFDFDFSSILGQLQTTVDGLIGQVLGQVLGGLTGLIGGTYLSISSAVHILMHDYILRSCLSRSRCHLQRILLRDPRCPHRYWSTLPQPRFGRRARWNRWLTCHW